MNNGNYHNEHSKDRKIKGNFYQLSIMNYVMILLQFSCMLNCVNYKSIL